MHADISRNRFDPTRRYRQVVMQQGRVQLDADWNEQQAIQDHHDREALVDLIGPSGVPNTGGGFGLLMLPGGGDVGFSPGRIWVGGRLCELPAEAVPARGLEAGAVLVDRVVLDGRPLVAGQWIMITRLSGPVGSPGSAGPRQARRLTLVEAGAGRLTFTPALSSAELAALQGAALSVARVESYTTQEDLPGAPGVAAGAGGLPVLGLADGPYLAYLDVWPRHLTGLEDPLVLEPALGGPDTTTRVRTVRQVRLIPVPHEAVTRDGELHWPALDALLAPSQARLQARSDPEPASDSRCDLPRTGGYRRLENQLYRVEVHDPPSGPQPGTVKWSRDNGALAIGWTGHGAQQAELVLAVAPRDRVSAFQAGELVELTDDARELRGEPGSTVAVVRLEGTVLTVDPSTALGPIDRTAFGAGAKVRRWNNPALVTLDRPATADGWLALEDGVQIRFEPGPARPGDHWMIPARTATGDVIWPRDPAGNPVSRPPDGIEHCYAQLGLVRVAGGVVTEVVDLRADFPTLTGIAAADVAFANATCEIPDAGTVQDALDWLCRHVDHRNHNQLLHGWGVVCGLKLTCDPNGDRTLAVVEAGTALDPEGHELVLDAPLTLRVLDLVEQLTASDPTRPVLNREGSGEIAIRIELDSQRRTTVRAERFDPKQAATSWLDGTLFKDYLRDCVEPVVAFLRDQLQPQPGHENDPAGPAQERLAALTNLLSLPVQGPAGYNVMVSRREHDVALDFYTKLHNLVASETFCAMYDGARPFPAYPFDREAISTLFGRSGHNRLRLRPGSNEVYTFGAGLDPRKPSPVINRYRLGQGLLAQIDPLAGTEGGGTNTGAAAVADVAFSADGRQIYAIVPARNGRDTYFRVGTVGDTISWQPVVTICNANLAALATVNDRNTLYAVGVDVNGLRNRAGLYRIDLRQVVTTPDPVVAFNAFGHLLRAPNNMLVATASSTDAAGTGRATSYNQLVRFDPATGAQPARINLTAAGNDDIAIGSLMAGANIVFTVTGTGTAARQIVGHDLGTGLPYQIGNTAFAVTVENSPMSLTMAGSFLVRTVEDNYTVRAIETTTGQVAPGVIPTQVGPGDLAFGVPAGSSEPTVFLVNSISNTVQSFPASLLQRAFPLDRLASYKAAALEAFADLTGNFLQYAKDCLCSKLLMDCPKPGKEDVVHLGVITIRNRQVYKACNFTLRKQVWSFPKVGYWLSAVPILPLVNKLIGELCCLVLPDRFATYQAPTHGPGQADQAARFRTSTVRQGVGTLQGLDLLTRLQRFTSLPGLAARTAGTQLKAPAATHATAVTGGDILGRQVADVQRTLADRVSDVEVVPYDGSGAPLLGAVSSSVRSVPADAKVRLYERDGQVLYFDVAGPGDPAALRGQIANLSNRIDQRDQHIEALTSRLDQRDQHIEALSTRVDERDRHIEALTSRLDEREQEIAQLRVTLTEQQDQLRTVGSLAEQLRVVQQDVTEIRRGRRPPG